MRLVAFEYRVKLRKGVDRMGFPNYSIIPRITVVASGPTQEIGRADGTLCIGRGTIHVHVQNVVDKAAR
jgi:hypothetical protein